MWKVGGLRLAYPRTSYLLCNGAECPSEHCAILLEPLIVIQRFLSLTQVVSSDLLS